MDYFKIQDAYLEKMKLDYESGVIANPAYEPYFQWKIYGASVNSMTRQQCYAIMNEAQEEEQAAYDDFIASLDMDG